SCRERPEQFPPSARSRGAIAPIIPPPRTPMRPRKYLINTLVGAAAVLAAGVHFIPGADKPGPIMTAAKAIMSGRVVATSAVADKGGIGAEVKEAVAAFSSVVQPLSRPEALDDAFRSYFA